MSVARRLARLPRFVALVWGIVSLAACTRSGVASLLPSLSLGVVTRRLARAAREVDADVGERWDTRLFVRLQFRPRARAAELPVRGELAPETWIAPCDADDVICLQEAADAEQELRAAFGELQ